MISVASRSSDGATRLQEMQSVDLSVAGIGHRREGPTQTQADMDGLTRLSIGLQCCHTSSEEAGLGGIRGHGEIIFDTVVIDQST